MKEKKGSTLTLLAFAFRLRPSAFNLALLSLEK